MSSRKYSEIGNVRPGTDISGALWKKVQNSLESSVADIYCIILYLVCIEDGVCGGVAINT